MTPQQSLAAAHALGKLVEGLEGLQAVLADWALDKIPPGEKPAAQRTPPDDVVDAEILEECGCTRYTRCEGHEATRQKGCTCNGPWASSTCAYPKHRAAAAKWPTGDPATVG